LHFPHLPHGFDENFHLNGSLISLPLYYQIMDTLAANAKAISVETFKQQVLMWEYIITAIIFLASYFVLKRYKKNQLFAQSENKKYNTGS